MHNDTLAVAVIHQPVLSRGVQVSRGVVWESPYSLLIVAPLVVSSVVYCGLHPSQAATSRRVQPILS